MKRKKMKFKMIEQYTVNLIAQILKDEIPALPMGGDLVDQDVTLVGNTVTFEISKEHCESADVDGGKKFRIFVEQIY